MREMIQELNNRYMNGYASVLVTIVANKGSAPRGAGSYMVVGEEGRVCGTIGGGMLEFQAISIAQEHLRTRTGELKQYRLRIEESAELGMVCGGDVDVLFTYISIEPEMESILQELYRSVQNHQKGWLLLSLDGKRIRCEGNDELPKIEEGIVRLDGEEYYIERLEHRNCVYIFGGGHIAQELVPVLTRIGFRCIVTDDREEFATQELFPLAESLNVAKYTELHNQYDIGEEDYIIAVTRGHLGDFHVQEFALRTKARYIGVVGSKAKIRTARKKLVEAGFTEEDLARITSPIGIEIKSETPAEIAISIAAQLILVRAERKTVTRIT